MKKVLLVFVLVFSLISWNLAGDFSLNLNINYNSGNDDFFNKAELPLTFLGLNYIETTHNKLGIGFNLGLNIPLMQRLYLVPGFNVVLGHQAYTYAMVANGTDAQTAETATHYFQIYSGELNLQYDLLVMENGWLVNAVLGLNYNKLKSDTEMRIDDDSFWGMTAGLGAKFFQLKHFGFQFLAFYKTFFGGKDYNYMGLQTGLSYRF